MLDWWVLSYIGSGMVLRGVFGVGYCSLLFLLVAWELFEWSGHELNWKWGPDAWWGHESWESRWLLDIGSGVLGALLIDCVLRHKK